MFLSKPTSAVLALILWSKSNHRLSDRIANAQKLGIPKRYYITLFAELSQEYFLKKMQDDYPHLLLVLLPNTSPIISQIENAITINHGRC